jgi:hypothetical protein
MRNNLFDKFPNLRDMAGAWPLLALFALTFVVVLYLQPLKAGLALWGVSKVLLLAWLGNVIDRVSFQSDARPYLQPDSIRYAAAWVRRALIIAATILAGGMIP